MKRGIEYLDGLERILDWIGAAAVAVAYLLHDHQIIHLSPQSTAALAMLAACTRGAAKSYLHRRLPPRESEGTKEPP